MKKEPNSISVMANGCRKLFNKKMSSSSNKFPVLSRLVVVKYRYSRFNMTHYDITSYISWPSVAYGKLSINFEECISLFVPDYYEVSRSEDYSSFRLKSELGAVEFSVDNESIRKCYDSFIFPELCYAIEKTIAECLDRLKAADLKERVYSLMTFGRK